MTVIAINNNKGGVLKTSTVINLAGVLAKEGKKVLIADLDNQANIALSFGRNPDLIEDTIYEVLLGDIPAEKAIINVYKEKKGSIDILPANDSLIGFDFTVIGDRETYAEPFNLLKKSCDHLRSQYDFILLDTPPSLGLMVGNVLTFADEILIPFAPEQYSMRSLVKILETIADFKEKHNPSLTVLGIVATLVDARATLHQEILQETRKYAYENGWTLFETVIPKSVRFPSSVAYKHLPATLTEKNHKAVDSYFDLWKEIKANGI